MCRVVSFSGTGAGHEKNEDAFEVRSHPGNEHSWLCTLADGQGGQRGGQRAAEVACSTAMNMALALAPTKLLNQASWTTILRTADNAVAADPDAGFTTLIGLCLVDNELCGASSGDSGVLLVDAGGINELTSKQAKNPPVGSECAVFVPFAAQLVSPWMVMVMSDGVWKYIGWDQLRDCATRMRGQPLLDCLQEKARLRGSKRFQDDFTIVVLEED
jgi:serine/threonine protein phosphatase PrpC